jgi:PPOX class probable F420-dependent enzyme
MSTISLTTYRRDGTPVSTPVSIAADDGHRYFRTWDTSWKAKRLRRNPSVQFAPSTFRGKPTGPAHRATARRLSGEEERKARHALGREHPFMHGVLVPVVHRLQRVRTVHYELVDAG